MDPRQCQTLLYYFSTTGSDNYLASSESAFVVHCRESNTMECSNNRIGWTGVCWGVFLQMFPRRGSAKEPPQTLGISRVVGVIAFTLFLAISKCKFDAKIVPDAFEQASGVFRTKLFLINIERAQQHIWKTKHPSHINIFKLHTVYCPRFQTDFSCTFQKCVSQEGWSKNPPKLVCCPWNIASEFWMHNCPRIALISTANPMELSPGPGNR